MRSETTLKLTQLIEWKENMIFHPFWKRVEIFGTRNFLIQLELSKLVSESNTKIKFDSFNLYRYLKKFSCLLYFVNSGHI